MNSWRPVENSVERDEIERPVIVSRFENRRRPKGWLSPSVQNKVEAHIKLVDLVCEILPVTTVTVEVAQFDTQLLKNPDIQGVEYQQGEQMGFWNVREYVLFRDHHQCQRCHGKSGDKILNVDHIESRKTGGDSPDNLLTLCEMCHDEIHRKGLEYTPCSANRNRCETRPK